MSGWSEGLAVDFGALGLYSTDGSTWSLLSAGDAEGLAGVSQDR